MSEVDTQTGETVTHEGVVVEKSPELEEFPVPAVMLVARSEREEPVTLTLRDPLPAGVSTENVGLHPDYGEESLDIAADHVRLEHELAPGEEFTALYGLREVDADALTGTLQPPEPAVSSSTDVTDRGAEGGEDATDDVQAAVTALEADDTDQRGPDTTDQGAALGPATVDGGTDAGPNPDDEAPGAGPGAAPTAEAETTEAGTVPHGDGEVAAALAAELRHGDVADEDITLLREELDLGSGSTEARIQHLQSEVSDLRAYTDAMEEFLDEQGPTRDLLADLDATVDSLESELAATTDRVDEHAETVASVESELDAVHEDLASLSERVDGELAELSTDLEDLRSTVEERESEAGGAEDAADRLDELESSVDRMAEDLAEVAEIQERLQSVFGSTSEEN